MDTLGYTPDAIVSPNQLYAGGRSKRDVSTADISYIANRIERNGWSAKPVTVQKFGDIYRVVDGHHRVCAAARAGILVPITIVGNWDGDDHNGQYWDEV